MTDTIAHPPLPEPAGHVFTYTMEAFAKVDCHGHIYSLPQSDPVYGSTVPLYAAQQMREYRDSPAWQPIETAPKDGTLVDLWADRRLTSYRWCQLAPGNGFFEPADCGPSVVRDASHWMPLPAAPIEQAGGEKP